VLLEGVQVEAHSPSKQDGLLAAAKSNSSRDVGLVVVRGVMTCSPSVDPSYAQLRYGPLALCASQEAPVPLPGCPVPHPPTHGWLAHLGDACNG
jgi:hypothetical protein